MRTVRIHRNVLKLGKHNFVQRSGHTRESLDTIVERQEVCLRIGQLHSRHTNIIGLNPRFKLRVLVHCYDSGLDVFFAHIQCAKISVKIIRNGRCQFLQPNRFFKRLTFNSAQLLVLRVCGVIVSIQSKRVNGQGRDRHHHNQDQRKHSLKTYVFHCFSPF